MEIMKNEFENGKKDDCNVMNEEFAILIDINDSFKTQNELFAVGNGDYANVTDTVPSKSMDLQITRYAGEGCDLTMLFAASISISTSAGGFQTIKGTIKKRKKQQHCGVKTELNVQGCMVIMVLYTITITVKHTINEVYYIWCHFSTIVHEE